MANQILNDTSWVQIGANITEMIVQASGEQIVLAYGSVAPTLADPGFDLPSGIPVSVPNIATFGGNIYVRSLRGGGSVRYVAA